MGNGFVSWASAMGKADVMAGAGPARGGLEGPVTSAFC